MIIASLVNKLDTPKLKMFCMEKSWTKVQTDNGSAKVEPVEQSEEGVGKGLHQIGGLWPLETAAV